MKRIVSLISVAIMLTTAAVASADMTVFSGSIYDVVITNPTPVGANPAGENLMGFMLKIVNTTGNSAFDPGGFNGNTPLESNPSNPTGPTYAGIMGVFHNQYLVMDGTSPTIDDPDFATSIDTHFNLLTGDVLLVGKGPTETNNLPAGPTAEPFDATGPWAAFAMTDFGDRLYGNFALNGGAAGPVWELAYIAAPMGSTVFMEFFVTGVGGGEDVVGSFPVVPEPATMSLLAIGGIGALLRRRK